MKQQITFLCVLALAACNSSGSILDGDPNPDPDGDGIAEYQVNGTVVDFVSGDTITGSATISVDGLEPPPTVSVSGADFTLTGVPPHSVFNLLAGSPPAYRSTYNQATEVGEANVNGLELEVVSEQYLGSLASSFGVTLTSGTTVVISRLVDETGAPAVGIPASAFQLDPGTLGPYFLDANRQAAPNLNATSSSGFVVLFDVPPGLYSVTAASGSGYTMTMPVSPTAPTAATLAEVTVLDGEAPMIPTNISFDLQVAPIFELRGCVNCHDGGGIGKDLGDLHLNGEENKMYREVAEELSPNWGVTRVDLAVPENSLLLKMPSREDPPDIHPNVTFASPDDYDYQIILQWIREGARHN